MSKKQKEVNDQLRKTTDNHKLNGLERVKERLGDIELRVGLEKLGKESKTRPISSKRDLVSLGGG